MKRIFVAHIGLMSAAVAAAVARSPTDGTTLVFERETTETLGQIPPILTKEMLAGTQPMLQTNYIKKIRGRRDLNPVSIIKRDSSGGGSQCATLAGNDERMRRAAA